jgi:cytidine deaminase
MSIEFDELLECARVARENAYAPYSGYRVGAALLTQSGDVFTGVNLENASYGLAICAERSAVAAAIAAGHRAFEAIAIAGPDSTTTVPCGACRQVLNEFSPHVAVIFSTPDGRERFSLDELLPLAFGPENLGGIQDDLE